MVEEIICRLEWLTSMMKMEILKIGCNDEEFIIMIVDQYGWKEGKVPKEWTDAILVPYQRRLT